MLTQREIISTLEMLRNENLDVRTVTLGINLLDCAGSELSQVRRRVAERLMRLAGQLVPVCDRVGQKYGIPVVNKRIAVSPIAAVGAALSPPELVELARTLDAAAREVNVDFIGGFTALVEKGMARGDRALIAAIPEALAATERVCASVNVASTRAGINMDAVLMMGATIKRAAELSADRDGVACTKLCVFANIPEDIPFMAGAYLGIGEADAVINVGVSGPGVVKKAIDRALASQPGLDLGVDVQHSNPLAIEFCIATTPCMGCSNNHSRSRRQANTSDETRHRRQKGAPGAGCAEAGCFPHYNLFFWFLSQLLGLGLGNGRGRRPAGRGFDSLPRLRRDLAGFGNG